MNTRPLPRTVALGSDHAGFEMKQKLIAHLKDLGVEEVIDMGPESADRVDYPDFAQKVAWAIIQGEAEAGVLVCGSGIGISISANKIPGIRAALVHDDYTARMSRAHNNAQIVCVGARVIGEDVARSAVTRFLETDFEGGRHADRVQKIHAPEGA